MMITASGPWSLPAVHVLAHLELAGCCLLQPVDKKLLEEGCHILLLTFTLHTASVPPSCFCREWWAKNAPAAGRPSLAQFGKDLGIASKLYTWSGSANPK
jgi:hypothetical protein